MSQKKENKPCNGQFQGGHLQNSHGLEQRRGELQHLRQFQLLLVFHALSPFPIGSSLMIA